MTKFNKKQIIEELNNEKNFGSKISYRSLLRNYHYITVAHKFSIYDLELVENDDPNTNYNTYRLTSDTPLSFIKTSRIVDINNTNNKIYQLLVLSLFKLFNLSYQSTMNRYSDKLNPIDETDDFDYIFYDDNPNFDDLRTIDNVSNKDKMFRTDYMNDTVNFHELLTIHASKFGLKPEELILTDMNELNMYNNNITIKIHKSINFYLNYRIVLSDIEFNPLLNSMFVADVRVILEEVNILFEDRTSNISESDKHSNKNNVFFIKKWLYISKPYMLNCNTNTSLNCDIYSIKDISKIGNYNNLSQLYFSDYDTHLHSVLDKTFNDMFYLINVNVNNINAVSKGLYVKNLNELLTTYDDVIQHIRENNKFDIDDNELIDMFTDMFNDNIFKQTLKSDSDYDNFSVIFKKLMETDDNVKNIDFNKNIQLKIIFKYTDIVQSYVKVLLSFNVIEYAISNALVLLIYTDNNGLDKLATVIMFLKFTDVMNDSSIIHIPTDENDTLCKLYTNRVIHE